VRVTAALAWYAETPATLTRCALSLRGYCDTLLAIGGRWEGFPAVSGDNEAAQAVALAKACDVAGIEYDIRFGDWESQVEKRACLMSEACKDSDWVLVIDADEFIERGHPAEFHRLLSETEHDVARVFAFRIPIPYGRNIHRVYRSSTNVTVKTAHNGYVTQDGRFLNGDPCYIQLPPVCEIGENLVIAHDLTARGQIRKQAREAYNRHRRKTRLESWV